jgi:two-component system response regulator YesN
MTFVEALTKRRMEKAIELLENTSLKTYEIAEKCGYNDANYFSAIFKRTTNMTPREYARTLMNRKGTYEKQDQI